MFVFIAGGAKSGKSHFAQDVTISLAEGGRHYYIATLIPVDKEDEHRIEAHLRDRAGLGFETVEAPTDLPGLLGKVDREAAFLLDSTTALYMNELFPDHVTWQPDKTAAQRTAAGILEFASKVKNLVVVSDCIYSDAMEYDSVTEIYRKGLALIDRQVAKAADAVIEMSVGNIILHKGELPQ